jgi:RNA polymerase sigma factor (sigma-70 family)
MKQYRYNPSGINVIYSEQVYYRSLKHPSCIPLSKDEEKQCIESYKQGDIKGLHKLVTSNLRIVVTIARRMQSMAEKLGVHWFELVGPGNDGLIYAVGKFDPSRGYRFASYASHWARVEMQHHLADYGRPVHVPSNSFNLIGPILNGLNRFMSTYDREPHNADELAAFIKKKPSHVKLAMERMGISAGNRDLPLNEIVRSFADDDSETFESYLDLGGYVTADIQFEKKATSDLVTGALERLTDRERFIVGLRHGLTGEEPKTLQETADKVNLTRERVRQIEAKALIRLKYILESAKV